MRASQYPLSFFLLVLKTTPRSAYFPASENRHSHKAINPLVSDPAIDGVVINFLKLKGWVSKLTTYFQIF